MSENFEAETHRDKNTIVWKHLTPSLGVTGNWCCFYSGLNLGISKDFEAETDNNENTCDLKISYSFLGCE